MKKAKLNNKLNLKKEVISGLNQVKGGADNVTYTAYRTCVIVTSKNTSGCVRTNACDC